MNRGKIGGVFLAGMVLGFILLCMAASFANGQEPALPIVKYRVAVLNLAGSPVSELRRGSQYWVALYVTDLREPGAYTPTVGIYAGTEREKDRGVFAAYTFVKYNPAILYPDLQRSIQFKTGYSNGKIAVDSPLGIKVGGFGGIGPGSGNAEFEVCRIPIVTAQYPIGGMTTVSSSPVGIESPMYDTLVYANYAASPPEIQSLVLPAQMAFVNVTLPLK